MISAQTIKPNGVIGLGYTFALHADMPKATEDVLMRDKRVAGRTIRYGIFMS